MTRTEVSRDFRVSESLPISFEASGLIPCRHDTDGEPVYQEREVRLVNEIRFSISWTRVFPTGEDEQPEDPDQVKYRRPTTSWLPAPWR